MIQSPIPLISNCIICDNKLKTVADNSSMYTYFVCHCSNANPYGYTMCIKYIKEELVMARFILNGEVHDILPWCVSLEDLNFKINMIKTFQ